MFCNRNFLSFPHYCGNKNATTEKANHPTVCNNNNTNKTPNYQAVTNPRDSRKNVGTRVEILDLQNGNFANYKALKGKHKGKFRKRAGNYRVIYLKEGAYLVITIIRVA